MLPEYYLVQFVVDEEVCAVPAKMVVDEDVGAVGEECQINWTNGQTYAAKVLAFGKLYRLYVTSSLQISSSMCTCIKQGLPQAPHRFFTLNFQEREQT